MLPFVRLPYHCTRTVPHPARNPTIAFMTSNPEAQLEQLVERWYGYVFAYCFAHLHSREDAEDAAQETFARWIRRTDHEAILRPDHWLRATAKHICVDQVRRNKIRSTTELPIDLAEPMTPSAQFEQADDQAQLLRVLSELEFSLREVILLHYFNALSYDDMATWLGVARSTVSERLSKARHALRTSLYAKRSTYEL